MVHKVGGAPPPQLPGYAPSHYSFIFESLPSHQPGVRRGHHIVQLHHWIP